MMALALLDWPTLPATKQENKSALAFQALSWPDNWKGDAESSAFMAVLPTRTSVTSDAGTQGGAAQCYPAAGGNHLLLQGGWLLAPSPSTSMQNPPDALCSY